MWADDLRCELLYAGGPAHTTNDIVVWFPERSVAVMPRVAAGLQA
jgi:cyclase